MPHFVKIKIEGIDLVNFLSLYNVLWFDNIKLSGKLPLVIPKWAKKARFDGFATRILDDLLIVTLFNCCDIKFETFISVPLISNLKTLSYLHRGYALCNDRNNARWSHLGGFLVPASTGAVTPAQGKH